MTETIYVLLMSKNKVSIRLLFTNRESRAIARETLQTQGFTFEDKYEYDMPIIHENFTTAIQEAWKIYDEEN